MLHLYCITLLMKAKDYSDLNSAKSKYDWSDTEGRVPGGGSSNQNSQARFFGIAHLLSSLLSLNVNSLLTVTSTALFTITSTATIVSVKSCINAGQFIVSSTNTCSRKRRETNNAKQIDKLIEAIVPNKMES